MYEFALKDVLKSYGFSDYVIHSHQKGYRNEIWPVSLADGRAINVTFYKREAGMVERIERADAVSEYLAGMAMPTRKRIDPRLLQLKNNLGTTSVGVYTYLPGETIPWEAYTMTHIKLLGKTMSNMHSFLAHVPVKNHVSVYDEYQTIIERMRQYFIQPYVEDAMKRKLSIRIETAQLNDISYILQACSQLSGQQVLHMDFVRGNVLFDVAKKEDTQQLDSLAISGILDFEKTAIGHPVVDISRTLAFLLVDCKYKSSDKVCKYFLLSGYQKRGKVDDVGDDAIRTGLITLFLLYDFYKFLRHNPYESLQANEHYRRTKDILQESGVIRYT